MTGSPDPAFEFETRRLRMRLLGETDQALFCGLYSDAETMRYIGEPFTEDKALRSFQKAIALVRQRPIPWVFLAVVSKDSQKSIGMLGVPGFSADAKRLEVGTMLRAQARRLGFATEALTGLAGYLFGTFPIEELWVRYAAGNVAAERTASGAGFTPATDGDPANQEHRAMSIDRGTWLDHGSDAINQRRSYV